MTTLESLPPVSHNWPFHSFLRSDMSSSYDVRIVQRWRALFMSARFEQKQVAYIYDVVHTSW